MSEASRARALYRSRFRQLIHLRLEASFHPRIPVLTTAQCDRELDALIPPPPVRRRKVAA